MSLDVVRRVAVIGGGPAGLMAAEAIAEAGHGVDLYDAMPSVGRKFLLAGIGGLNLTHSEAAEPFVGRFGARAAAVGGWLEALDAQGLRDWARSLGVETFVGTSGRVFPVGMKAAPLLRAWLQRLRRQGVRLHMRQRWLGWEDGGGLRFNGPLGEHVVSADATVLALGGASWPRLGSDGAWRPWLEAAGVDVAPLQAANCGFDVGWSAWFAEHFAGAPMKSVALRFAGLDGQVFDRPGEFVITRDGVEGSLVYAASAAIRDAIAASGPATVALDLVHGRSLERLAKDLARGRGSRSLTHHLHNQAGLDGAKAALLRETLTQAELLALADRAPAELAARLKAWPLTLTAPRPIAEAISTAGGVRLEALDAQLMLRSRPGVFCAGEMLDWEAPTGGYLLTACIASGRVAGRGVVRWLDAQAQAQA